MQLLLTRSLDKAMVTRQITLLILSILVLVACNQPIPDPSPEPKPVTPPVEPLPDPCEIHTTDYDCISLEQFNALKTDLVSGYEADPTYYRHFYGRESSLAEAWSNLRLVYGDDTRPGAGIRIGMIDDGIDLRHPGLADTNVIERFYGGATKETSTTYNTDILPFSHGTAVAGIILANGLITDDYYNFHGFALATQLHFFTLPESSRGINIAPHITELMETARAKGIRILNISLSKEDQITDYETLAAVPVGITTINAFKQDGYDDKIIIVRPVSNESKPQPSSSAGLPHFVPELKGHYIAAMAVHEDGTVGQLSNHCGLAAEWCIATPSSGVPILYSGLENGDTVHKIYASHGTSGSAPQVSAGLALMQQMFRDQLSSEELVTRLCTTANKTGLFADSSIYGQGLVDLDAATSPVGDLRVLLTETSSALLSDTQVNLGAPFGDSLSQAMTGREIAALDALNAPFFMPLERLYRQSALVTPGVLYRPGFMVTGPVQYLDNGLGNRAGLLAIADSTITATMPLKQASLRTYASLTRPESPAITGADLAWPLPSRRVSLQTGSLYEQGSLLGTRPYGAFGDVSTLISYSTLTARDTFNGWQIRADLQLGYAVPRFRGAGIISTISPLVTSAFNIDARRQLTGRVAVLFSVSQPLRIESGTATLVVPTGRRKDGAATLEQFRTNLTPSGRQIDLSTRIRGAYRRFNYDLSAAWSLDPVHRSSASDEFRLQFSLQASY